MKSEIRDVHTSIMATVAALCGVVLIAMLWRGLSVQAAEADLNHAEREYRRAAILKIEERLDVFGDRLDAIGGQ